LRKIKVFVIDDSAVVRDILVKHLAKYSFIEVVGTAVDPFIAREKIVKLEIDVITLDIELPRMDGLTFLKYLMKYYPIPVIILSSLADKRNRASMEALELGAVDIVPKPGGPYSVSEVIDILARKIEEASHVDFEKVKQISQKNSIQKHEDNTTMLSRIKTTNKLIAIGASTGGTNALEIVFKNFEKSFPPTVCVIHMPEGFTATFAERLNDICQVNVKEAENNEKALPGWVYIAPGNYHLVVKALGTDYILKTIKTPYVHNQRPAVDVLFKSVAENVGQNTIAALLTGMGRDGALGMLDIKKSGGYCIAQDEATSVVFGMPKVAIELGATDKVLPIDKITHNIAAFLRQKN
jgi:two-component system chemotaxis response regulator CheB